MTQLLLIEDDPNLGASLSEYLRREGFALSIAKDLESARNLCRRELTRACPGIDLIILDWMLPDGQGIDFLRELRKNDTQTPIILLTSRGDLIDKILGLETGANDYLTKPFEPRELVARIRVQLRSQLHLPEKKSAGPIELDITSRRAYRHGKEIELTKMEFDLLLLLFQNPNRVFSREELLNKVWGYDRFPTTRTVDMHILQLRQKFGESYFETVRGVGYRLKS